MRYTYKTQGVCSTQIDFDIENANTLVIIDSDKFGLSQLYQIRGRVGRSNRLSYAYITYRKNNVKSFYYLNFLSAFQCPGKGHFVGIFQLAANRNAVGKPGHLDLHRSQQTGNIHGRRFALRIRIGGHNDFLHAALRHTVQQGLDLQIVGMTANCQNSHNLLSNSSYHRHYDTVSALLIRALHRDFRETILLREALQSQTFIWRDFPYPIAVTHNWYSFGMLSHARN